MDGMTRNTMNYDFYRFSGRAPFANAILALSTGAT